MIVGLGELAGRAAEMRRVFDRSFAAPARADDSGSVDFIAVRLAGDRYAIRVGEIAGLFLDIKVTPCPSPVRELRGIATFRGAMLPVYDLAALAGYPPVSDLRWLVTATGEPVALAFDAFESHFRVSPDAVASGQDSIRNGLVREVALGSDSAWPIIDIPSVVAAIKQRASTISAQKEQ